MSIWDKLDQDGHLGSSVSGENDKSFLGERDMRATSSYSDSVAAGAMPQFDGDIIGPEMAHVSDVIENMQREVVGLRQQLMAVEDNVTGVIKASAQTTSETAKHRDIWNLEKKLQEFTTKNEEDRSAFLEGLEKQENFLSQLATSQDAQKEAFTSFANEIRRKNAENEQNPITPLDRGGLATPDSLENSMFADLDPAIADMARRAGIGLEDLHDIALKITEVNKADEVAKLQLAHVEKVNEQLKEISLTKLSGTQTHEQQKLINTMEQQSHDKVIRLAEITAEAQADVSTIECDKDVRNHRDVEMSKARWASFTAVSNHWSQTLTTSARWGSMGGGIAFIAYCVVQVAQAYFGQ